MLLIRPRKKPLRVLHRKPIRMPLDLIVHIAASPLYLMLGYKGVEVVGTGAYEIYATILELGIKWLPILAGALWVMVRFADRMEDRSAQKKKPRR